MTDARALLQHKLDALRVRETAAKQLLVGEGRPYRKSPEKAAKLPETEREQTKLVAKWELAYKLDPTEFNHTKFQRACGRLANTQRQIAKLAQLPFAEELAQLRMEIVEIEQALAVVERIAAEYKRDLWELLTERYAIDSITGDITLRATGGRVTATTVMVEGVRHPLSKIRETLLTGGLV